MVECQKYYIGGQEIEMVQIGSYANPDDETVTLIYPNGTKEKRISMDTINYDLNHQGSIVYIEEMEFEMLECFLPHGMVCHVPVHPKDEIYMIKKIVINSAILDGNYFQLANYFKPGQPRTGIF